MRLALGAVILASLTSVASAGTYVGLGIGSDASGSGEYTDGRPMGDVNGYGRSGRLMVGTRISKLSLEAQGSRYDLSLPIDPVMEATQLGAALKLSLPLGSNFEIFGKGGIQRTWLSSQTSEQRDAAGNGWLFGAGFEYRLNLGVTSASVFVDYQRSSTGFTQGSNMLTYDGVMSMWTLGATVGL